MNGISYCASSARPFVCVDAISEDPRMWDPHRAVPSENLLPGLRVASVKEETS